MEDRFDSTELAMFLLDQDELVQLGAMLSLQAHMGPVPEEGAAALPPVPLAFEA